MLNYFKQKIESLMGEKITANELVCAIQAAKDDVTSNNLLFGKDVSSAYFEEKVCDCIRCLRKAEEKRSGYIEKAYSLNSI